uniref:Uncharacterized protein n=1 Tax=Arundo donax TaxID=35708 RepID=A0A0A9H2G6_ARUDO
MTLSHSSEQTSPSSPLFCYKNGEPAIVGYSYSKLQTYEFPCDQLWADHNQQKKKFRAGLTRP